MFEDIYFNRLNWQNRLNGLNWIMNSIYFHLIGGAAGDMLLVSLLELGCPLVYLKKELKKLNIGCDLSLKIDEATPCHVPRKKLIFKGKNFSRHQEIVRVIKNSGLDGDIKTKAREVYGVIATAEEKIHRTKNIHYHHLGEVDAVAEICGFFIALKYLAVEQVYVSVFPLSKPAPAVLELLRGKKIGIREAGYESVTPTAAALLKEAIQADLPFAFKKSGLAFGAGGSGDYLAAYLIDETPENDTIIKVEVNIDDMNPQLFENCFEKLFAAGAKDVYLENILMKKSRPAFVLNVLCAKNNFPEIRKSIFSHTSTFGIRYLEYKRDKLPYEFVEKNTKFGKIKFRVARGRIKKETPEYSDCLSAATKLNIPLIDIYRAL